MESNVCLKCLTNIIVKDCPGIKCAECGKWIHHSCANFPPVYQKWNCSECSNKIQKNSLPNKNEDESGRGEHASELIQLSEEITELKHFNTRIMNKMKALSTIKSIQTDKN